jgi:hypothetical protein
MQNTEGHEVTPNLRRLMQERERCIEIRLSWITKAKRLSTPTLQIDFNEGST